jgi:hypothetical protein
MAGLPPKNMKIYAATMIERSGLRTRNNRRSFVATLLRMTAST